MIAQPGRGAHEQGILEATSLTPQQQHNISLAPRGGDATPPSAGPPVSPGHRATTTDIAWSKEDVETLLCMVPSGYRGTRLEPRVANEISEAFLDKTSVQVRDCYDIIGALVPGDSEAERPQLVEHCLTTLHNSFVPKINSRKTLRPASTPEAKKVRGWRCKLQKTFFTKSRQNQSGAIQWTPRDLTSTEADAMSKLFTQMQSSKISPVAIKLFKIRKVLGFIKQRGDDFGVRAGVLEGIMKKLEQPY
ncbi:hypothetical protein B0H10DRAFT_2128853 [Mycena sp. CBHHK59/15]|nr:hypothetical protein B0H10DRAFT_2128853 [Mycena sp. CBHHK59/15]